MSTKIKILKSSNTDFKITMIKIFTKRGLKKENFTREPECTKKISN